MSDEEWGLKMMNCPKCGSPVSEGGNFCTSCGANVTGLAADAPTTAIGTTADTPTTVVDVGADTPTISVGKEGDDPTKAVDSKSDAPTTANESLDGVSTLNSPTAHVDIVDEVFPISSADVGQDSATASFPSVSNLNAPSPAPVSAPSAFVASEGAVQPDSGKLSQNKPLIVVLLGVLVAAVILAVSFFLNQGDSPAAYGDEIDVATDTRFIPRDDDGDPLGEYEVTIEPADNRTPTVTYVPLRVQSDKGFTVQDVVNIQEENSMSYGSYRMQITDSSNRVYQTVTINIIDPESGTTSNGDRKSGSGDSSGTNAGSGSGNSGAAAASGSKGGSGSGEGAGSPPAVVDLTPPPGTGTSASSSGGSTSASGSGGSTGTTASTPLTGQGNDEKSMDEAYLEVVQQLIAKYGESASHSASGGATAAEGVCLVELVDFDGDGTDELVVGYYDKSKENPANASGDFPDAQAYAVQVWGYRDGKAEKLHEQEAEYSNGGFAFLILDERTDDTVMERGYYGDEGGSTRTYAYYGFEGDGFKELASTMITGMYTSNNEYYVDGKKSTKEEYEKHSEEFLGKHDIICYQFMTAASSTPVDDRTSYTASQLVERAKANIEALQKGAASDRRQETAQSSSGAADASKAFAAFPMDFLFTSGAGGWSTTITVQPDGSFTGAWHDYDMGVTGAGYPNGTVHFSEFEGRFTEPEKVSDIEYRMQIASLRVTNEEREEIVDGQRQIWAVEPYGLGGETDKPTGDVRLYLPGRSTGDLSQEFLIWTFQNKNTSGKLDIYALDVLVDGNEYGWMGDDA